MQTIRNTIAPFVKWAGGKRQLIPRIIDRAPENFNRYFEPFVGGGAVLLALRPTLAHINDVNEQLIFLYREVKDNCGALVQAVEKIDLEFRQSKDPKTTYYEIRALFNAQLLSNKLDTEFAARFLFINKHCFNGLYRVNAKGEFNVPYNGSLTKSVDVDSLKAASDYLQHVEITSGDFEAACATASKDDFIFFDSPYAPLNPTSFTSYTKEGFEEADHIRLAKLFKELDSRGCKCMLTNHDTDLIRSLYKDFNYEVVDVKRFINSDASNRKGKEVIVRNYE